LISTIVSAMERNGELGSFDPGRMVGSLAVRTGSVTFGACAETCCIVGDRIGAVKSLELDLGQS